MKLITPLIAAGLAFGAFTTPASARPSASHHGSSGSYSQRSRTWYSHHPKSKTPPGWSKGKKTGWKGHNAPPGLWKKRHDDRSNRWDSTDRNRRDHDWNRRSRDHNRRSSDSGRHYGSQSHWNG
jgi:hypothetical protein